MKKILFTVFILTSVLGYAQINVQTQVNPSINQENPFLDASNYNTFDATVGKGLYFPRTNLTTWAFKTTAINPGQFATYYDGMVVYNTATGNTGNDATTQGKVVAVEPGFYYFSNPGQSFPTGNLNNGEWKPLSSAGAKLANYSTTEVKTGQKWIDDKDVFMKVIAYNQPVSNTEIDLSAHGFTANQIDRVIGFRMIPAAEGSVGIIGNVKSYDPATNKGIIGSYAGAMSTTLGAGDYTIIMEYTKQ